MDIKDVEEFAKKEGISFYECSAKEELLVEKMFYFAISEIEIGEEFKGTDRSVLLEELRESLNRNGE